MPRAAGTPIRRGGGLFSSIAGWFTNPLAAKAAEEQRPGPDAERAPVPEDVRRLLENIDALDTAKVDVGAQQRLVDIKAVLLAMQPPVSRPGPSGSS